MRDNIIELIEIIRHKQTLPAGPAPLAAKIELWLAEAPTALERAVSLAAWKTIREAQCGKARGGDRKSAAFRAKDQSEKISLWSDLPKRVKLSVRAIEINVKLAHDLGASDIKRLLGSPIENNLDALRCFAALDERLRDKVYRIMCARPDETWDEWLRRAGIEPEKDSADAFVERFVSGFRKQPREVKRRILRELGVPDDVIGEIVRREKKGRDE